MVLAVGFTVVVFKVFVITFVGFDGFVVGVVALVLPSVGLNVMGFRPLVVSRVAFTVSENVLTFVGEIFAEVLVVLRLRPVLTLLVANDVWV